MERVSWLQRERSLPQVHGLTATGRKGSSALIAETDDEPSNPRKI